MDGLTLRRGTESDLGQIREIWLENELGQQDEPPPHRPAPSCFRHELETGEMWVAERNGRLIGFAAILDRGPSTYLAELFVRPACQSAGVGQALLARTRPRDGREFCTLSSTDPRAHALYLRAGMRPKWPCYNLRAKTDELTVPPADGVEAAEAEEDDWEFLRSDADIGTFFNRADHGYLVAERAAVPLSFRRGSEPVGYGYAQTRDDEAFWYPDAITLGPIGATTAEDGAACVAAAVAWARPRADIIQTAMPGPHAGLGPLVEAGFKIIDLDTFFSTDERSFNPFDRYIFF